MPEIHVVPVSGRRRRSAPLALVFVLAVHVLVFALATWLLLLQPYRQSDVGGPELFRIFAGFLLGVQGLLVWQWLAASATRAPWRYVVAIVLLGSIAAISQHGMSGSDDGL